jgi:hypothetical protein
MKFIDMTGQRFGRLVTIRRATADEQKSRHTKWLCKCDCGAEILVVATNLRRGNTTSCGCYSRQEHSKMLKGMWAMAKEAKGNDHDKTATSSAGANGEEAR